MNKSLRSTKFILKNFQSPGDIVMLTAAVRDLHESYPNRFVTDVRTPCPQLWESNPYITPLDENAPDVRTIDCHYPLIHQSNEAPYHFIHAFGQYLSEQLKLNIRPTVFRGDIYISDSERSWKPQIHEIVGEDLPFWIIVAGGKYDFTAKWWAPERYQDVVDYFRGKILFVQVGEIPHYHPPLQDVLDLRGKTDLRELVRLVYHSQGVLCPVNLLMHLAAAVELKDARLKNRPCVVIAGGREPAQWEAYPHHQYIHTNGTLPCCQDGGCWKSRVSPIGDGDEKDLPQNLCVDVIGKLPRCMNMISATDVIRRIEMYFQGSAVQYMTPAQAKIAREALDRWNFQCALERNSDAIKAMSVRFDEELAVENAPLISERYINIIPPFPEGFQGRGIVIPAGGLEYFANAWVCIKMLRRSGCQLPIQMWHLGKNELDDQMKSLVAPMEVECIDAYEIRNVHPARILNGWELKPYAILHSPFNEVLLLDADNVPVRDPEFLFETREFLDTGAIFWPDYERLSAERTIWKICGVEYRDEPEFETGQIVVDKERCWKALCLSMWYNEHSDFYYHHILGDKETFHMAFRKLNQPFSMPKTPIYPLKDTMCQHDFNGNRIFQHRNFNKWSMFGENRCIDGFMYENECLQHLNELRSLWDGVGGHRRFRPVSKPQKVCEVANRIISRAFDYHRIGYDRRPMRFMDNGIIGEGAADCEIFWDLKEEDEKVLLEISSDTELTCRLKEDSDGVWRGQWMRYERMPVELSANGGPSHNDRIHPTVGLNIGMSNTMNLPYVKEAFLNEEECDLLIQVIRRYAKGDFPARVATKMRTDVPVRSIFVHGLIHEAELLENIKARCQTEIGASFSLKHPIYPEFMMLQANYPGDGHARHADNRRYDEGAEKWIPNHTPQRVITCGLYLNRCGVDFIGGELIFPSLGKSFPARPGLLIAYPSDERFEHEVPAIQSGERYSILLWFTDDPKMAEPPLVLPANPKQSS
jgi:ADP-heptose:LPS heptosyltransferase